MRTDEAGPDGSELSERLGLVPERAGQPRLMTVTPEQADNMHGHWYSPAAVREKIDAAVAAERERAAPLDAELQSVLDWARKEKAPLREQEIASIVRVLANFRA